MDDVHRVDIHARQPIHHSFVLVDDVVELEIVALHCVERWTHLLAADFIPASVDRIEQTLGEVSPGAEELHLLADEHGRNTTGDGAIVSPTTAHDFVALELKSAGVNCDPGSKPAEVLRQPG